MDILEIATLALDVSKDVGISFPHSFVIYGGNRRVFVSYILAMKDIVEIVLASLKFSILLKVFLFTFLLLNMIPRIGTLFSSTISRLLMILLRFIPTCFPAFSTVFAWLLKVKILAFTPLF